MKEHGTPTVTGIWPREGRLVRKSLQVFAVHAVCYTEGKTGKRCPWILKEIVQILPFTEDLTLGPAGLRFAQCGRLVKSMMLAPERKFSIMTWTLPIRQTAGHRHPPDVDSVSFYLDHLMEETWVYAVQ